MSGDPEDLDVYVRRVRNDHYLHWAAMIAVSVYMWQLHGAIAAIILFLGLLSAIIVTNIFLLARLNSLRAIRWSRWGWVALAFALIAMFNTEIGPVR